MQGLGDDTAMRAVADKLGLTYVGTTASEAYQREVGALPDLPLLAEVQDDEVVDLMIGRLYETNAQVFDLALRDYRPEPLSPRRSCVALTFLADFPTLGIAPHTPMTRLRAKAEWRLFPSVPPSFKQRFDLRSDRPEDAELLLSGELLTFLGHQRDDLRIEIAGGAILGHCAQAGEPELIELVETVHGVHNRIPHKAWTTFSLLGNLGG